MKMLATMSMLVLLSGCRTEQPRLVETHVIIMARANEDVTAEVQDALTSYHAPVSVQIEYREGPAVYRYRLTKEDTLRFRLKEASARAAAHADTYCTTINGKTRFYR